MNTAEVHQYLLDKFGAAAITGSNLEAKDPWIEVASASLVEVCQFLHDDEKLQFDHLNNLSGVDYFEPDEKKQKKFEYEPHIEVVYHLTSVTLKHRTTLKVMLPRWENDTPGELPKIDSVSSIWKIADWHERETYDLVGIAFNNHPNLRRILCPEDWVGHALRKDYNMPLEYHGIRGK